MSSLGIFVRVIVIVIDVCCCSLWIGTTLNYLQDLINYNLESKILHRIVYNGHLNNWSALGKNLSPIYVC